MEILSTGEWLKLSSLGIAIIATFVGIISVKNQRIRFSLITIFLITTFFFLFILMKKISDHDKIFDQRVAEAIEKTKEEEKLKAKIREKAVQEAQKRLKEEKALTEEIEREASALELKEKAEKIAREEYEFKKELERQRKKIEEEDNRQKQLEQAAYNNLEALNLNQKLIGNWVQSSYGSEFLWHFSENGNIEITIKKMPNNIITNLNPFMRSKWIKNIIKDTANSIQKNIQLTYIVLDEKHIEVAYGDFINIIEVKIENNILYYDGVKLKRSI